MAGRPVAGGRVTGGMVGGAAGQDGSPAAGTAATAGWASSAGVPPLRAGGAGRPQVWQKASLSLIEELQ